MRGCISSTIYPDMLAGKITFLVFGYAVCPKNIAKPLTEKLLYPEERSRLMRKWLL